MDEKTLKALQGSIEKWRRIVEERGVDKGTKNCPLCQLFYKDICTGCPVSEHTGYAWCEDTPYPEWTGITSLTILGSGSVRQVHSPEQLQVAQNELDFLKSLLPRSTGS